MNRWISLLASLALVAVLWPTAPVPAASGNKPWEIRDLNLAGFPACDGGGTWSYKVTWKPIVHEGKSWPSYKIAATGCKGNSYNCSAGLCTAEITSCSIKRATSSVVVTADIGKSVSGVRESTGMVKPAHCK